MNPTAGVMMGRQDIVGLLRHGRQTKTLQNRQHVRKRQGIVDGIKTHMEMVGLHISMTVQMHIKLALCVKGL